MRAAARSSCEDHHDRAHARDVTAGTSLAAPPRMPDERDKRQQPPKRGIRKPERSDDRESDEQLREQTKTETEERPYLDTEGGE
jgi:hypothetical protein